MGFAAGGTKYPTYPMLVFASRYAKLSSFCIAPIICLVAEPTRDHGSVAL